MGFLDNIIRTGKDTAKSVKNYSDTAKLNNQIADEEGSITAAYTQIGRLYYAQHPDAPEAAMQEHYRTIQQANARIAELRAQIEKINTVQKCPQCGATYDEGQIFCTSCGFRLAGEQPSEAPAEIVCTNCGMRLPKDALFCSGCGTPVKK